MRSKLHGKMRIVSMLMIGISVFLAGCGVKGDPVPPTKPPQLGRGQPTYRRATEKIKLKKITPADGDEKSDKESDDE